MSRRFARKGFTLIELLVVIGIMAILIGILQPSLTGVAAKTREYGCRSHLKQIGMAMQAYSEDNGVLPEEFMALDRLLRDRSLFDCPSTSKPYVYRAPAKDAGRDTVVAACVDWKKPPKYLPHQLGSRYLVLTVGGDLRKAPR